jgi:hypothetical protein
MTLLCLLPTNVTQAQSESPKLEVIAHYMTLHLSDFDEWTQGPGSCISYNINGHVALEGEVNFLFPRGSFTPFVSSPFRAQSYRYLGEHSVEGLFGIRAGFRGNTFGLFGKLRPGLIHFSQVACPDGGVLIEGRCYGGLIPGSLGRGEGEPAPLQPLSGKARLALDVGGVLEFHPTRRYVLRVDLGDTVIRNSQPGRTSHNFQLGIGVGIRF